MKNLKKLLAVVLVIAMAISTMAMAGAMGVSDYTDADSITQTEAVDVLSNAGVLQGYNGAFMPTDNFTREQAAKVVCYLMVGATGADMLSTSTTSFSDVGASRWSAAYIEYCVSKGVIDGMGDGTFMPEGNVTGAQFAKMLLVAIGYGKNAEYVGANWEINAISDAATLGILTLSVNYSIAATREQVASYALNALTVDYVVYSSDTSSYVDKAKPYDNMAINVFNGLEKTSSTANGVGGYKWTDNSGVEYSGFYANDNVLGTSMNGTEIAELATSSNPNYIAALATTIAVYYNGAELVSAADGDTLTATNMMYYNTTAGAIYTSITTTASAAADTINTIPMGGIVNFISTNADNKTEKVTIIEKDVASLAGDPIVNVSTGNVTISGIGGCTNQDPSKVPGYEDLTADDVVLWYKDASGVYHIELATSMSGTISSYVTGLNFTIDGVKYSYSQLFSTIVPSTVEGWIGLEDTTIYTDDNGYVVQVTQAFTPTTVANYLFVTAVNTSGFDDIAKVVLSDGTTATITVSGTSADSAIVNTFFKFSVTDNDTYMLTEVVDDGQAAGAETQAGTFMNAYDGGANEVTITKNTVKFLTEAVVGTAELMGNANTVFLYQGVAFVTAYTGITNVPNYIANLVAEVVYVLYDDGVALMVYADGGVADDATNAGDWVYIMDGTKAVNYISSTLSTWSYQAIVNGVETTIETDSNTNAFSSTVGLYLVTSYDSNGYVAVADNSPATSTNYAALAGDTLNVSSGNITANGTDFVILSSDVSYYYIDASGMAVTTYELTVAQVNALDSIGANVDFVETSGTDATIAAVYIYAS